MSKKTIVFIIIIALILIGGGVYLWHYSQQPKDVIPEGVKIEIQDGTKLIKNELADYEVEVPKDLIVQGENSSHIKVFTKESSPDNCPLCPPHIQFSQIKNSSKLSLEDWLQKQNEEVGFLFWDEREKININNIEGYKIKEEGDPEQYNYYFAKNDKIYVITTLLDTPYLEVIKSFKLK